MSRVKLKRFKVSKPTLEVLERYLRVYPGDMLHFQPDSLLPINATTLFGNANPLVLDLGSGKGEFVVGRARHEPDMNFVGIEWHSKSLWYSINLAHAAGVTNVRFVRADIRQVLFKVTDQAAQEVYIMFPPPIVKPSRIKNDFFTQEVCQHIYRILVDDGVFRFVTDSSEYFARKVALVGGHTGFERIVQSQAIEGGITAFQQRWERYGIASNRAEYRRLPTKTG